MFYRLYRGVAKYIVYGNTFSSFEWLRSLYAVWRETERAQNQELVTKRGTTSVAWPRVFKHCSFKTTDFKPLKIKQQSYMRARLFLCERSALILFADFERLHEHTYMRQNPRLCKYPQTQRFRS